jgi:predicted regulator of Ras-like GTPase activity (Roadblock/LC7/MglB family)
MKNYMISTTDGSSLINTFQDKQENEVAALTAALSGLGKGLKSGIDIGDLGTIVINGSKGRYGMRYIDNERILSILATDTVSEKKLVHDIEEMASALVKVV